MAIPNRISEYLRAHDIKFETLEHQKTTTAMSTANTLGIPRNQIAKVVACSIDNTRTLLVLPCNEHIHIPTLKDSLNAHNIRLHTEVEMIEEFPDCELGAQPAIGSIYSMAMILSKHFKPNQSIVFNAGNHTECISIPLDELIGLENPRRENFSVTNSEYEEYRDNYYRY